MVSLILKVVAICIALASASLFGPSIFEYADDYTGSQETDIQDAVNRSTIMEEGQLRSNQWLEFIGKAFDNFQKNLGNIITSYVRNLFPNASPVLGSLIIALLVLSIGWWKSEFLTVTLRAVFLVLIVVMIIGIILAMVGLL